MSRVHDLVSLGLCAEGDEQKTIGRTGRFEGHRRFKRTKYPNVAKAGFKNWDVLSCSTVKLAPTS